MGFKSKLLNFKDCAVNSMIYNTYYNQDIDEKLVYLESRDGLDFTGNIFRIVEELSIGDYGDLKIHVHAKPQVVDKIKALQKNYNLKIDKIITKEALATKTLEKAKYIFTDSGIRPKYVKREGQIFVNTWHGTPLKVMGNDNIEEEYRLGNVQHPLLSSDYLLYPNDYMMEKMLNAYMIEKIYSGKILLEGYPRNSVFFNESWLKKKLELENYEIFAYMPTFRGVFMNRDDELQKNVVEDYLKRIDEKLNDNQIFFVKLHILNESQIDFTCFSHIRPFPNEYETYDVLNMSDVLVTDYSSVFFDFANTGRKIIIFNYDEDEYLKDRGFYFSLSDLPFPKVQKIDDLISELNSPKDYDDSEFILKFCIYDRIDAAERLSKHIFKCENTCKELDFESQKENILIYTDFNNIQYLCNIIGSDANCYISYKQWDENIVDNHEEIFKRMPDNVRYMPFRFDFAFTYKEKNDYYKYLKMGKASETLLKALKRQIDRQYPNFPFVDVIVDTDEDIISLMFEGV